MNNFNSYSPLTGLSTIYADNVNSASFDVATGAIHLLEVDNIASHNNTYITTNANIVPKVTNTIDIGTTTNTFANIYGQNLYDKSLTDGYPVFSNISNALYSQSMTNGQLIIGNTGIYQ